MAESDLQKGLTIDPTNGALIYSLANILRNLGRFTEAEKLYKKSLELDPLATRCLFDFSILYGYSGKYDEAIAQVNKALSVAPRPIYYSILSNYYLFTNRLDEAMTEAQKCKNPYWYDPILSLES
jgi:tetratricopeptide (TPR) repeat protein